MGKSGVASTPGAGGGGGASRPSEDALPSSRSAPIDLFPTTSNLLTLDVLEASQKLIRLRCSPENVFLLIVFQKMGAAYEERLRRQWRTRGTA
jgi:hypothetical protein